LKKSELESHQCKDDIIDATWRSFMDVLAKAASMRCPQCKRVGLKDLACNHITCTCGHHWCYHCGKSLSNNDGHFIWTKDTPPDSGRCPQYLNYVYGENPAVALNEFHKKRIKDAVNNFQNSVDVSVYEEMIKTKFPDGLPIE
jgi:hypothetical protein